MRQITCKQMGGPCDAVFEGETTTDIAKQAEAHITEMAKSDPKHQETYDMMAKTASTPEGHDIWKKDFQAIFDAAPTV